MHNFKSRHWRTCQARVALEWGRIVLRVKDEDSKGCACPEGLTTVHRTEDEQWTSVVCDVGVEVHLGGIRRTDSLHRY